MLMQLWLLRGVVVAAQAMERHRRTGRKRLPVQGHQDYVLSVAVSHDGQWIVSGSKDQGIQFWDARLAVVQLPTGGLLATGSGDWQARIWSYGPL
ncbi:hypothetical protein M378DRAFT_1001429 [Amanita muscaria Koide BX008]|uniref:Uncharacterized protein n=1 Tax=Amanita muscaria (strain Koide BX008) TaxID=946122 RepID=A0A0C2WS82_AMAMK|nr:hypothetical protein M378DRAFT_1001429 [Amanita muscaria Koide BX008]